jgi:hypothetical protein
MLIVRRTGSLVPDDKKMPVTPPQRNAPTWKIALGVLGLLVLFLIVIGFTTDLWLGFPLLFSARSWTTWLLGILALAVLYLLGEGGSEWIKKRDRRSHPVWKRAWNLILLVGFVGSITAIVMVVIRLAQRP